MPLPPPPKKKKKKRIGPASHGYSFSNTSFPGGVLTNITHPAEDKQKPVDPKAKPKIDKHEDAPLMDNEYRLGTTTPCLPTPMASKSPTVERIDQVGKSKKFLLSSS